MTILWKIDDPVESLLQDAQQAEQRAGLETTKRARTNCLVRAQAFREAAQTVDLYMRRDENEGEGVAMKSVTELMQEKGVR